MSHQIMVLKDGHAVEHGSASQIFHQPQEKYTNDLFKASQIV